MSAKMGRGKVRKASAYAFGLALALVVSTPLIAQDRQILPRNAPEFGVQDRDGQDHPLLRRYPGSFIRQYRAPMLDVIVVPTGPIVKERDLANRQVMTGRVTHIDYRLQPAIKPSQIERHYSAQLRRSGFAKVYACTGKACGEAMGAFVLNSGKVAPLGFTDGVFNDDVKILTYRKNNIWIVLYIAQEGARSMVYQAIVEDVGRY